MIMVVSGGVVIDDNGCREKEKGGKKMRGDEVYV